MEITYLGHSCFRLKGRDATLITDPHGALGPLAAEVVTISHDHPDHANADAVRGARRVVRHPGEYEVSGVHIKGVRADHDDQHGRVRGRSIAYSILMDEVGLCHLGDLGHTLTASQVEELGAVQVLFVPVGGGTTLSLSAATEVIGLLAPRIVVPMHYHVDGQDNRQDLQPLEPFLRQMGVREVTPQPRLTITATSFPAEMQVVVLETRPKG